MHDLTYRSFQPEDFEALHEIVSHWSVVRQLGRWPWPAQAAFTRSRCVPYSGKGFVWAIVLESRLVGSMAVTEGELGYMISRKVHGRGIASQATRHAIQTAFTDFDWSELKASSWQDNPASAAVLRKFGFVHWQTRYTRTPSRFPTLVHQHRLPRAKWERLSTIAQ